MSVPLENRVGQHHDVGSIEIAECSPAAADAVRLLGEFYQEQLGRYGFADPVDLDVAEFIPPRGVFAVVHRGGLAVGCGCYRWHDRVSGTIEIKKTYVSPAQRGIGAGRVLLAWLEGHAIAAGARRVILETGVRNTAARGLFTCAGYQPTPSYVPGRDPAINRAYTRMLVEHA